MTLTPDLSDLPVRFSHLKAYGMSALQGRHARITDMAQTTAMQRGTAVHALVLGGRKIIGYPGSVRRGKEYDAFVEANPDAEILTSSEYDKANRMADAVRNAAHVAPYLQGVCEQTLRFDWNGLSCRATPDVRGAGFLTELKCSSTSDPERFPWQARRMKYPAQMWFQKIGAELNGHMVAELYMICVEDKPPHPVTLFQMMPEVLDIGSKQLVMWAERLKVSEGSGVYPPYSTAICPIDEPREDDGLIYPDDDETAQE